MVNTSRPAGQTPGWGFLLARGIVLAILGFIGWGLASSVAIAAFKFWAGAGLMIAGVLWIIETLMNPTRTGYWSLYMGASVFEIVLGFVMLVDPMIAANAVNLTLGIWGIAAGSLAFAGSFNVMDAGVESWWLTLIGGVISAVLGWITASAVFLPTAMALAGWTALLVGATGIVWSLQDRAGRRRLQVVPERERYEPPRRAA